jgi:hypothetical protein
MTEPNAIVANEWGHTKPPALSDEELAALDVSVGECRRGDNHGVKIIGRGRISIVIEWHGNVVVKPLPLFSSRTALDDYSSLLEEQSKTLAAGSVGVLPTRLQACEKENGAWAAYLIQPRVPTEHLLAQFLRSLPDAEAVDILVVLASHLKRVVSPRFGLDGDISNWCVDTNGQLLLLDNSTPLVRDHAGRGLLDFNLFLGSMPRALRLPLRRFVVPRVVARFFDPRRLFVDILSGFYSEDLSHLLPQVISRWNSLVEREISEKEVLRYKRRNERLWRALVLFDSASGIGRANS